MCSPRYHRLVPLFSTLENHIKKRKSSFVFVVIVMLCMLFFPLLFHSLSPPLVHLIPHSHLDAGWRRPLEATFHSSAVPYFKRTVLELLLDDRRTAIFEPMIFVAGWLESSGESPLSVNSQVDGGFTNPIEMYVEVS